MDRTIPRPATEDASPVSSRTPNWQRRLLPQDLDLRPAPERERLRLLLWFWLSFLGWGPVTAAVGFATHSPLLGGLLLSATALAGAGVPTVLRRWGSAKAASGLLLGTVYLAWTLSVLMRGGLPTPNLAWGITLPVAALLLFDLRQGVLWLGLCLGQLAGLFALQSLHVLGPLQRCEHEALLHAALTFAGAQAVTFALAMHNDRLRRSGEETRLREELVEDRMRRFQRHLRSLLEELPDCLMLLDRAGVCQECWVESPELMPADAREWTGRSLEEIFPADTVETIRSCLDKTLEYEVSSEAEYELEDTPEREFYRLRMLPDLEGRAFAMVQNVTGPKRAEEHRWLLLTAIEQSAESIVITDAEGSIQYVNPAFQKVTGYPRHEVIGQNPRVLKSGLHDSTFYSRMWATLARGEVWTGRLNNRRKDGSILLEDATISPIRDESGRTRSYVAVKRDVTEIAELESRLLQARKLESIGRLAAGIAHEINTPAQYVGDNLRFLQEALQGFGRVLEILEGPAPDGPEQELLEHARALAEEVDLAYLREEAPGALEQSLEGMERITKIVRAMKEFSHPGSSSPAPCDLNAAIVSTITVARNEWKYVADMVQDLDPELPPVPLLRNEFNQALLNLIVNATHAIADALGPSPEGKGTITIGTRRVGEMVEIRVQDTGTGIPVEAREKIFEPFFTTKEVGKGTGQGLAMAHDLIVHKHGGRISFETEEGRGTTFLLILPLQLEAEPEPEAVGV